MSNPFDSTGKLYQEEIRRREQEKIEIEKQKKIDHEKKLSQEAEEYRIRKEKEDQTQREKNKISANIMEENLNFFNIYSSMIGKILNYFGESIWGVKTEYKTEAGWIFDKRTPYTVANFTTEQSLENNVIVKINYLRHKFASPLLFVYHKNEAYIVGFQVENNTRENATLYGASKHEAIQVNNKYRLTKSLVVISADARRYDNTTKNTICSGWPSQCEDYYTTEKYLNFSANEEMLIDADENQLIEALKRLLQSRYQL